MSSISAPAGGVIATKSIATQGVDGNGRITTVKNYATTTPGVSQMLLSHSGGPGEIRYFLLSSGVTGLRLLVDGADLINQSGATAMVNNAMGRLIAGGRSPGGITFVLPPIPFKSNFEIFLTNGSFDIVWGLVS